MKTCAWMCLVIAVPAVSASAQETVVYAHDDIIVTATCDDRSCVYTDHGAGTSLTCVQVDTRLVKTEKRVADLERRENLTDAQKREVAMARSDVALYRAIHNHCRYLLPEQDNTAVAADGQ